MRVADYIFSTLADYGTDVVFMVSGGGAMFLNDALGQETRLRYVCNLHEQACAMAAEGYARISKKPGVVCVTTGPGGTNAITGVAGAWLDSIPMIVISGQVKKSSTISSCPQLQLRQLGDQELNIIDLVRPITKYAEMLSDVQQVRPCLEKAWRECLSGRPGPVWLDIPLDLQAAQMPAETGPNIISRPAIIPRKPSIEQVEWVVEKLKKAQRPAVIAGIGVRHSNAEDHLLRFIESNQIPLLTSISGIDLVSSDHPLFFGRPGILGERAANFIMQNCDLLLVLGTRMCIRIIGYAYDKIAREACKIMVDIDEAELQKPTFQADYRICADAGCFLTALLQRVQALPRSSDWLAYCQKMRHQYPVITREHRLRTDFISSYVFPEILGRHCEGNEIIVTGNGTAYTSSFQTFPIKPGMRMFANQGCASMGYDIPAAIGAALAEKGKRVICITGDGSLQMNLQELQTVKNYQLPIKFFVYNNSGYLSIKLTQKAFFEGRFVGSEENSGVILPELRKIAAAFDLPFFQLRNHADAEKALAQIFAIDGAVLVEVMTDPFEVLGPKAASKKLADGTMISAPLEDMFPFLPREEFNHNMIIPPLADSF